MLEDLLKKAMGVNDSQASPVFDQQKLDEQIKEVRKWHSNLPNMILYEPCTDEHSIGTPNIQYIQQKLNDSRKIEVQAGQAILVPGGTNRTFYSVSTVDDLGNIEESEIEFSIEDQFTNRDTISDYRGGDIAVGTLLESIESDFRVIANRVGHMNALDYQGEIFYNREHEAWFFADDFGKVDWI